MQKILLATDLGANSDRAMERALKLAKETRAQLHIVHALPAYKAKKLVSSLKEDTEELIKGYVYDYKDAENLDIVIKALQDGEFYAQILEYARKIKTDLIVMGIHGKTEMHDLFTGTTLERVVRKGHSPVLMVKNKPTGPYQSVLAGIDFAPGSRAALRMALDITPKGVFEVVHAYHDPVIYPVGMPEVMVEVHNSTLKNQKKTMDAFLNTEKSRFQKEHSGNAKRMSGKLLEGPVYDILMHEAKKMKADIITIGAHGRVGVLPGKLGGTASDILARPPCDVLVARDV